MSQKAITALVAFVAALLGVVVVVGLAQHKLDPTGVAVALSSLLTGAVVGVIAKGKGKP